MNRRDLFKLPATIALAVNIPVQAVAAPKDKDVQMEVYLGKFWHPDSTPNPNTKFVRRKLKMPGSCTEVTYCTRCLKLYQTNVGIIEYSFDIEECSDSLQSGARHTYQEMTRIREMLMAGSKHDASFASLQDKVYQHCLFKFPQYTVPPKPGWTCHKCDKDKPA